MINLQKTKNQLASSAMRSSTEKNRHIFVESMIFENTNDLMIIFVKTSREERCILAVTPLQFRDVENGLLCK